MTPSDDYWRHTSPWPGHDAQLPGHAPGEPPPVPSDRCHSVGHPPEAGAPLAVEYRTRVDTRARTQVDTAALVAAAQSLSRHSWFFSHRCRVRFRCWALCIHSSRRSRSVLRAGCFCSWASSIRACRRTRTSQLRQPRASFCSGPRVASSSDSRIIEPTESYDTLCDSRSSRYSRTRSRTTCRSIRRRPRGCSPFADCFEVRHRSGR